MMRLEINYKKNPILQDLKTTCLKYNVRIAESKVESKKMEKDFLCKY